MTQQEPAFIPDQPIRENRFQFTGKGSEYFSIWIVNLLLSILTLGIYSAWAKVRRERYFHRNTLLDQHPFDYTGNPRSILWGRVLALAIIIAGSALQKINVALALGVTALFALIYPWAVVRSAKFRARNTRYRNIAFQFTGTTLEAAKVYFWLYIALLPMVAASVYLGPEIQEIGAQGKSADPELAWQVMLPFMIGLAASLLLLVTLFPLYLNRSRSFLHRHLRYGNAQGDFDGTSRAFFKALLRVSGASIIAMIILVIIVGIGTVTKQLWLLPFAYLTFLLPSAAYTANITNTSFGFASIGGQRFASDMKTSSYALLLFTNLLLLVFTLGLAWPWVQVRMARYRLEHLSIHAAPASFEGILGEAQLNQSAFGEEVADFLDFDISL